MLLSTIFAAILPLILSNPTAAQSSTLTSNSNSSLSVVCIAGQCIQGTTNITLGATLEIPSSSSSSSSSQNPTLYILPGTYTSTTSPQLLHNYLTNPIVSLNPLSSGFSNVSTIFNNNRDLPLDLNMSPGITVFQGIKYSGNGAYSGFPETADDIGSGSVEDGIEMNAASFAVSNKVYVVISTGNGNGNERVVLWESVPDVNQLPFSSSSSSSSSSSPSSQSLLLIDIHATTCNPTCSSNSICSPTTRQCICSPGFTGSSCESCSPGHFGPECKQCSGGCDKCDEGIQGTGICLKKSVVGKPEDCGCVNGICGNDGTCTCITGWKDQTSVTGTGTSTGDGGKCSSCQDGFYLTSSGDCKVCQPGCEQCADNTGSCISCRQGFSLNSADNTKCDFVKKPNSLGQSCPDGSFSDGTSSCKQCSSACRNCSGITSNDCVSCAVGRYFVNGNCVEASSDGVCQGTTGMIADNIHGQCEACPAKCTSCTIPGFSPSSIIDQAQCTGCLPGSVLSEGKCIESCPSGTFLSPQDNLTCLPCDSSCGTCIDSATFCLTCNSNQFAFQGKCTSTCRQNTFTSTSSSTCISCHADCATCSGSQFNQCTSCPSNRPVLKDGRCLGSCSRNEFFDNSNGGGSGNGECTSCDGSCSTCDGKGDDRCLSCSQGRVLREGKCVVSDDDCETIQGLGVCLKELVIIPKPNSTNDNNNGDIPPIIDGISDPTTADDDDDDDGNGKKLEWWQILLMVLGVLFIVLVVVVIWRRWMRNKRTKKTRDWAREKGVLKSSWWKRMFSPSHYRNRRNATKVQRQISLNGSRNFDNGELPIFREDEKRSRSRLGEEESMDVIDYYGDDMSRVTSWRRTTTIGNQSLFSEITGERRRVPEPREPVRHRSVRSTRSNWVDSEASKYARTVRSERMDLKSNNPFVRR